MQFYGISFEHPYKQSGRCQDVLDTMHGSKKKVKFAKAQQAKQVYQYPAHPDIDQTVYTDARKKYHKTACTSLHEDEHLDARNVSKTLQLN